MHLTMKIRIQGSKEQCLDGIQKLRKSYEVLKVSGFYPSRDDFHLGKIFVELK